MKTLLKDKPLIQKHLYEKGFLITDRQDISSVDYPFYNNWEKTEIGGFNFWINKETKLYVRKKNDSYAFVIGHCYNPYTMEHSEEKILEKIQDVYQTEEYFEYINELSGVFVLGIVNGADIEFLNDASGMQYVCYGKVGEYQYITSHMRLIGDFTHLTTDSFVEKLINYRWYKFMMGNYLPGDLTCYNQIKRVIPNVYVSHSNGEYSVKRFYPSQDINVCKNEEEYNEVIDQASKILGNIMEIIPKKWNRPAISLTGGIDSNTTFAAANGVYDKYETFSYVAMEREKIDSIKAKEISDAFNVKHTEYTVPQNNDEIEDFEIYKAVLKRNGGDIGPIKDNDARKKIVLIKSDVCDVEIKSWISETIRAYAYKYFGKKKFRKSLSARNYTSLYKIFAINRKLVWKTDKKFKEYFKKYNIKENLYGRDESDFFVWEMMHGGKCGLDIGVMRSCFDIDIPYNNRKLLDLLLRVPLEYRISDKHHLDLKKKMNKTLYDMNVRVINANQGSRRAKMLGVYYTINSLLPF